VTEDYKKLFAKVGISVVCPLISKRVFPLTMKKIFSLSTIALLGFSFISCTDLKETSVSTTPVQYNSFFPSVAVKNTLPSSLGNKEDKYGSPSYSVEDRNRYVRTTAYSDMENEPGAVGNLNAAGTVLKYGKVRSAAADWSIYPLGTTFKIKGLPHTYVVDDYGSALVGTNTVDIYHPSLSLMNKWGTRHVELNIIQMGDWKRSEHLLSGRRKYAHCAKMYAGVVKNLKKYGSVETAQNN